jgi:hypothetical protein
MGGISMPVEDAASVRHTHTQSGGCN